MEVRQTERRRVSTSTRVEFLIRLDLKARLQAKVGLDCGKRARSSCEETQLAGVEGGRRCVTLGIPFADLARGNRLGQKALERCHVVILVGEKLVEQPVAVVVSENIGTIERMS